MLQKIIEFLPSDGSTVSGGTIKTHFGLDDTIWKEMKNELKATGKVYFGRGRGGTVSLLSEGGIVTTKSKKSGDTEALKAARETRTHNIRSKKRRDKIIGEILDYALSIFPNHTEENITVRFYGGWGTGLEPYLEVYDEDTKKKNIVRLNFIKPEWYLD